MATVVPDSAAGQRIDRFVADLLAEPQVATDLGAGALSRSYIGKLIEGGRLSLDGKPVKAATRLHGGEWLTVDIPDPQPMQLQAQPEIVGDIDVLYEDDAVIVVNKPAGMLVHPGAGQSTGTLVNALLAHCGDLSGIGGVARPGIVHRLDRGTSGVMVVAKHDRAHENLAAQFATRTVSKVYLAYVVGLPTPAHAVIDTLYGRHPTDRKRFSSRVRSGKQATTEYRVTSSVDGVSRLEVQLHTGRTHQIRVHFADHGHPLLGDPLYGPRRLVRIPDGPLQQCASLLRRQALHSWQLQFDHPISGDRLSLRARVPDDLAAIDRLLPGPRIDDPSAAPASERPK